MASSTVENYLKTIYALQQKSDQGLVPMGQLAEAMQVVPGTATSMIKTLAESNLVDYTPRTGVRLTQGGQTLALHVLRRHRLVESFLVKVLKLDWSEVHAEAEVLEHAISDKVLEKIDEFLGNPQADPHGDPIPPANGAFVPANHDNLTLCRLGEPMCIARIMDQDPDFLRFAEKHGLTPGVELTVEQRDAAADSITVKPVSSDPITIGTAAARKILVKPKG